MRPILAFVFVLVSSSVSAQMLAPVAADILNGYDVVGKITAAPDTAGDEILFRSKLWRHVLMVGRLHPSKSGTHGISNTPGLCLESVFALDLSMFDADIRAMDLNGDGLDDLVATSGGAVQLVMSPGPIALSACR